MHFMVFLHKQMIKLMSNSKKLADLYGVDGNVFFETDESRRKESLACAFRIADLSVADLKAVSAFKDVVKSYLKMCTIEAEK